MSFVPARKFDPEMIDLSGEHYSLSEYAETLADIRIINRFLGDYRAICKYMPNLVQAVGNARSIRVLDVGTGSADIPVTIVKWARRKRIRIQVTAVDNNPLAIREAEQLTRAFPEIAVSLADGFSLPFGDRSFDIVLSAKTLHHFNEQDTVRLLREMDRVSALGYIIMDLRRSRVAWLLISMLTRVFTKNRLSWHDAPLSVLRSYTVCELDKLAGQAGLNGRSIAREPFWLTIVWGRKGRT